MSIYQQNQHHRDHQHRHFHRNHGHRQINIKNNHMLHKTISSCIHRPGRLVGLSNTHVCYFLVILIKIVAIDVDM